MPDFVGQGADVVICNARLAATHLYCASRNGKLTYC